MHFRSEVMEASGYSRGRKYLLLFVQSQVQKRSPSAKEVYTIPTIVWDTLNVVLCSSLMTWSENRIVVLFGHLGFGYFCQLYEFIFCLVIEQTEIRVLWHTKMHYTITHV